MVAWVTLPFPGKEVEKCNSNSCYLLNTCYVQARPRQTCCCLTSILLRPALFTEQESEAWRGKVSFSRSRSEKAGAGNQTQATRVLVTDLWPCWSFSVLMNHPWKLPGRWRSKGLEHACFQTTPALRHSNEALT